MKKEKIEEEKIIKNKFNREVELEIMTDMGLNIHTIRKNNLIISNRVADKEE